MARTKQLDFAAAVGLTVPTVSKLNKLGIVDMEKSLAENIIAYCSHLREKAAGRSGGGKYDLTEERARLAHHQANIAALDEKVKRGLLIPSEIVLDTWAAMLNNMRARLLATPTVLAATCVNANREQIEDRSSELIRQALEELKDDSSYKPN